MGDEGDGGTASDDAAHDERDGGARGGHRWVETRASCRQEGREWGRATALADTVRWDAGYFWTGMVRAVALGRPTAPAEDPSVQADACEVGCGGVGGEVGEIRG